MLEHEACPKCGSIRVTFTVKNQAEFLLTLVLITGGLFMLFSRDKLIKVDPSFTDLLLSSLTGLGAIPSMLLSLLIATIICALSARWFNFGGPSIGHCRECNHEWTPGEAVIVPAPPSQTPR